MPITKTNPTLPLLCNGDRMTQAEFHKRYETYPEDVKFELVGGMVFTASPVRWPHGKHIVKLGTIFERYSEVTPGTDCATDVTAILGEESEPQPDLALRLTREFGGQSQIDENEYLVGAPELLAEIASSSYSIDMNLKRLDYHRAGVAEYVVMCLEEQEIHWFNFRKEGEIRPNRDGVWRSRIFPGLWIDGAALLACDSKKLNATLQQGLTSPAHAAFVRKLERVRRENRESNPSLVQSL